MQCKEVKKLTSLGLYSNSQMLVSMTFHLGVGSEKVWALTLMELICPSAI